MTDTWEKNTFLKANNSFNNVQKIYLFVSGSNIITDQQMRHILVEFFQNVDYGWCFLFTDYYHDYCNRNKRVPNSSS